MYGSDPAKKKPGLLVSIGRGIDLARRIVVNGVFLLLLLLLVVLSGDTVVPVPDGGALVVTPRGALVEQLSGAPFDRAVERLQGLSLQETRVQDLERAIRAAAEDERIAVLVLDLGQVFDGHLAKLRRVASAVDEFRAAGKPVYATADAYSVASYHLATAADEIYLHPLGLVYLDGYGFFRTYYKEGLDRYGIEWNVFRVGEYKSAVEPFLRDGMSEEAKEANRDWLDDLWAVWLEDVGARRELAPEALADHVARWNELLREQGGDSARLALAEGLVDHVEPRDVLTARLVEEVGKGDGDGGFAHIIHEDYLLALDDEAASGGGEGTVAVAVLSGTILGGTQPPGTIGGESAARLLRQARRDEDVDAVVVRLDTGGGSAFASEVIRRELELLREAGKPVVASMGSYAASGGYWIAAGADEIWAEDVTVTGAIGIFGTYPTFEKPLEKYFGTRVDGVGTTWMTGGMRPDRALDPGVAEALQTMIEQSYREFVDLVAAARGMSYEEADAVARGRVWSGLDAHDRGLVDELGGLDEAIAAAASLAELESWKERVLEPEGDWTDELLVELMSRAADVFGREPTIRGGVTIGASLDRWLARRAELWSRLDDPRGVYAHCLCRVE